MTSLKSLILSTAAAALLFTAPVQAADTKSSPFTAEQKAALGTYIHDYLLENPEVIIEAVNRYKTKEEEKQNADAVGALDKYRDVIFKDKSMPQTGNLNGDVTIVEFFDFNCGYCHRAFEGINEAMAADKNLRFVFIDLPILSPESKMASEWALAANKQGKYWEFHKAVMGFKGPKNAENLSDIAKKVGLDVPQLQKDASSPEVKAQLEKHTEIAQALRISGTPGFIVGDQIIRGFIPYEGMKTIIADARKGTKTQ